MKILIADDHVLVRDGIASLLRAEGFEVVGEAKNGLEALQKARELHPNLILMDITMPVVGGLEATRLLQAELPQIPVVILTVSDDEHDLFEAIKSGARDYLLKDLKSAELFDSLRAVARGEAVMPQRLAKNILEEFRKLSLREEVRRPEDALTSKEKEILELIAGGALYKEVGQALSASENTVKFYMRKILDKLHLQNRAQAVDWAAQHGLTSRETR